jgi:hypothetical protein
MTVLGKEPLATTMDDLFRARLSNIINPRHELVRLAQMIDWRMFDKPAVGYRARNVVSRQLEAADNRACYSGIRGMSVQDSCSGA